jgi:hypothetical protein
VPVSEEKDLENRRLQLDLFAFVLIPFTSSYNMCSFRFASAGKVLILWEILVLVGAACIFFFPFAFFFFTAKDSGILGFCLLLQVQETSEEEVEENVKVP